MTRRFLNLSDAGADAVAAMLAEALGRKAARQGLARGAVDRDAPLAGRMLAMLFERPSTRTRVSFDMAMRQLGGAAMPLDAAQMQLGRGESIADTARVLGRMVDAVMLRTVDHGRLDAMVTAGGIPVINALSDQSHPCQIVADLMTVIERGFTLPGLRVAWIGDGNNVCHSWIEAAGMFGMTLGVATPPGHAPDPAVVASARRTGRGSITTGHDAHAAVSGATVVITDSWASMGDEDSSQRRAAFAPFAVDETLMAAAASDAIFLHCLPAHRGEEVVDAVLDGPRSAAWDAAENRIHAQKAILMWVFGLIDVDHQETIE